MSTRYGPEVRLPEGVRFADEPRSHAGLDPRQFWDFVVRPVLAHLALPGGEAAERLVMGTGAHESDGFRFIDQIERPGRPPVPGPALGLFQMERATFRDLWDRYLKGPARVALRARVMSFVAAVPIDPWEQLAGNHYLGAAMCRIRYYERPFSLTPNPSPEQLARWWKVHYNTVKGAGTEGQFLDAYARYVAPLYA